MVMRELVGGLPLEVKLLERHEFSSQTFVPLDVGRWLVVVCPHAPLGGPDVAHSRALIAGPDQGITYRMNTVGSFWSCPVFVAHQLSASVVCVVGLVGLVGNALALSTNPRGLKVAASKRITRRPSSRR
jgi:ureidoglycolate hydrolase